MEVQKDIEGDLGLVQKIQKKHFDQWRNKNPQLEEGDKVYLEMENLITDEGSKKLSDKRTGPFKVVKKISDTVYELKLPPHMKCHPVFNIDLLTKEKPDPIPGRRPKEPAPIIIEGEPQYEVERLIDSNWYYGHLQYKVRYKGYGKEHDEWQFRDDLLEDLGEETLKEYQDKFHKNHPDAPRLGDKDTTRHLRSGHAVKTKKAK